MQKQRDDSVVNLVEILQEVRDARRIEPEQQCSGPARQTAVESVRPGSRPGIHADELKQPAPVSTTSDTMVSGSSRSAVLASGSDDDDGGEAGGTDARDDTETSVDMAAAEGNATKRYRQHRHR